MRPRLAMVTPSPPERSGLIDAVHELLEPLGEVADVRLYLDDPAIRHGAWKGRHALRLGVDLNEEPDLLPVYQVGNHVSCLFLLPLCYRFPGLLVLHDLNLHHLLARFFLQRGLDDEYRAELRAAHGESGDKAARIINAGFYSEGLYRRFPLFAGLVGRSRAVIVHNDWAAEQVAEACPTTPIVKCPLLSGSSHLEESVPSKAEARRRLEVPQDVFVVGTIGHLTRSRRTHICLEAFRRHLARFPRSKYLVAGRGGNELEDVIEGLGLGDAVLRLGAMSLSGLHAAIAACDVLCNLRWPSMGETSGSLVRILSVGRPALVSNHGQFLEFPEDFCPRVDIDERETAQLEAYFDLFASRPEIAERLGRRARDHMSRYGRPELAAKAYVDASEVAKQSEPTRPGLHWVDPAGAFRMAAAQLLDGPPQALPELGSVIASLLGQG